MLQRELLQTQSPPQNRRRFYSGRIAEESLVVFARFVVCYYQEPVAEPLTADRTAWGEQSSSALHAEQEKML